MKKILIAETNENHYGTSDRETGIWLEEITSFYDVVKRAGYDVDFEGRQRSGRSGFKRGGSGYYADLP